MHVKKHQNKALSGTALVSLIAMNLGYLTDNDPATAPDWNVIVPMLFITVSSWMSRPNGVSSEEAGAKQ